MAAKKARNLVICCDGTNDQFGRVNSNVVRLIQSLGRNPARQRLYYEPGVGTLPLPGARTWLRQRASELCGLAFGAGLTAKVADAYGYLMDFWKPGDRVFLFGFSRGAYTVRVLAGLLHALGLLPRGNRQLVPYVIRLFQALRREGPPENADASSAWSLGREFRWTLARHQPGGDDERRFRVHFLGLWDTVSSVGWAWDPLKFPYTARNPSVDVVRHAVSLDERRWFFRQNSMQPAPQQDFQELWFPGVHGDVGGDYPENEGGLWRVAFEWLLAEAEKFGLRVNGRRLKTVLDRSRPPERPWAEPQHDSLTGLWWPAEFFPKLAGRPDGSRRLPRVGLGRHRVVPQHALIHQSTLLRIRDSSLAYAPPNLSPRFLDRVRRLPNVPPWLPFER